MEAKFDGKKLIVIIRMQKPKLSKSGKNYVIASSRGPWESSLELDGRPVKVLLNAYTDAPAADQDEGDGEEVAPKTCRKK